MSAFWTALTRNGALTSWRSPDAALRGRTYAIPFDRVWNAALHLAGGGMKGWAVVHHDDAGGHISAVTPRRLLSRQADVLVSVRLDADGQTRVDVESTTRHAKRDFGSNRRRILAFLGALDRAIGANASQILDPSREMSSLG